MTPTSPEDSRLSLRALHEITSLAAVLSRKLDELQLTKTADVVRRNFARDAWSLKCGLRDFFSDQVQNADKAMDQEEADQWANIVMNLE